MKYLLKNNRDGAASVYRTTVEVSQDERNIYFNFVAEHSNYYCPYHNYNDIHSCGDAVEILIGIDSARKTYYELQENPDNSKMLAKMTVTELDGDGAAKLNIEFVDKKDCFFTSSTTKTSACIVCRCRDGERHVTAAFIAVLVFFHFSIVEFADCQRPLLEKSHSAAHGILSGYKCHDA